MPIITLVKKIPALRQIREPLQHVLINLGISGNCKELYCVILSFIKYLNI